MKHYKLSIDIGLFTVDKACQEFMRSNHSKDGATTPRRIALGTGARFADRSVEELADQGSGDDGMLGVLARSSRRAPLAPEAMADLLRTKQFTSGADVEGVIELYRKTATAVLGSIRELEFSKLKWEAADYAHLCGALRYCSVLERLCLMEMEPSNADVAAILAALPTSVKDFTLYLCNSLTDLPSLTCHTDMPALASLERLSLNCESLTSLPDLSAFTSLKELHLEFCESLTSVPDLSALTLLQKLDLNGCDSLTSLPDVSNLRWLWDFPTLFNAPYHLFEQHPELYHNYE